MLLLLVLFIILLDQIIKYFVSTNMFLGQSIPVLPQIFHLTYIQNPGAAFGILENQRYLFILIAAVLIVAVIYFYKKIIQLSKLFQVGIALLFGGAIGNMIDRIFIGRVIDYMDFRIWPVFNLADIAIVSGCAIIAFNLLFKTERSYKA
ncbi:signal peptidase II [Megamonas hypermegale]|uniref:Lipoprotein signal peptidase n=1 Tax=Megamonas hypermegale TaxID=158847 RepID=A0A921HMU2_9FIRM|nr:signal peptidase II [Megamonas hypermegale]MDM8142199.1 signal peptidase II [Megamonas hypermegale]HJF84711.1 signal peptidase II [Megamonas hypermegale]